MVVVAVKGSDGGAGRMGTGSSLYTYRVTQHTWYTQHTADGLASSATQQAGAVNGGVMARVLKWPRRTHAGEFVNLGMENSLADGLEESNTD